MPLHLDVLVRPCGTVCMRKLDRIIGDPPIDHVRETGNDRHALRTERERERKRKKKIERNIERRSRRFISSPKGLDRFMNLIDRSAKKKGHKISSRYAHWQRNSCSACKTCKFCLRIKPWNSILSFFFHVVSLIYPQDKAVVMERCMCAVLLTVSYTCKTILR